MSLTRAETTIKAGLDTDNAGEDAYSAWARVELALSCALVEAMASERMFAGEKGIACPIRNPVLETVYL